MSLTDKSEQDFKKLRDLFEKLLDQARFLQLST